MLGSYQEGNMDKAARKRKEGTEGTYDLRTARSQGRPGWFGFFGKNLAGKARGEDWN